MMTPDTAYQMIKSSGLMAGMRGGFTPDVADKVTDILLEADINIFELTMNSPQAIESMQTIKQKLGDNACVGMGTVLTVEAAKQVLDAGADFIVSPAFQPDIVQTVMDGGILIAPGVATPTEAVLAWEMGVKLLKLFPIGALGLDYFKAMFGPLRHMNFMINGAMHDGNAGEFIKAGAVACGMAGWLTGDGTWPADKLRQRAKILRAVIHEARTGQRPPIEI